MTKQELIEQMASGAGIKKAEAGRALESFVSLITKAMKSNDQVSIPKFGSFMSRARAARMGVNPRTKEPVQIKACKVPAFKASASLKEQLN